MHFSKLPTLLWTMRQNHHGKYFLGIRKPSYPVTEYTMAFRSVNNDKKPSFFNPKSLLNFEEKIIPSARNYSIPRKRAAREGRDLSFPLRNLAPSVVCGWLVTFFSSSFFGCLLFLLTCPESGFLLFFFREGTPLRFVGHFFNSLVLGWRVYFTNEYHSSWFCALRHVFSLLA